jgi:alpha-tubulin suppressor-like RCC1 family protein
LNDRGQLGQPLATTQSLFAVVMHGVERPKALAPTGYETQCVIDELDKVSCWGAGSRYELGNGEQADSNVPVAVDAQLNWGN